jgi:hypothetical protein
MSKNEEHAKSPKCRHAREPRVTSRAGAGIQNYSNLDVEAPGRQGAEAQEYPAYFELPQRRRTGWIDSQNVKLFLSEPLASRWGHYLVWCY